MRHYIFVLFLLSFFFLFPHLISTVASLNLKCRSEMYSIKYRTQKIAKNLPSRHHRTILSGCIFASKADIDNRKKNLLNSTISSTCPHNMVNFGLLMAEICWWVWGTPANFNGFRVLAALLHDTLVLGVSQTLRRWTEGATYIRQGGHHVGPTVLVFTKFLKLSNYTLS